MKSDSEALVKILHCIPKQPELDDCKLASVRSLFIETSTLGEKPVNRWHDIVPLISGFVESLFTENTTWRKKGIYRWCDIAPLIGCFIGEQKKFEAIRSIVSCGRIFVDGWGHDYVFKPEDRHWREWSIDYVSLYKILDEFVDEKLRLEVFMYLSKCIDHNPRFSIDVQWREIDVGWCHNVLMKFLARDNKKKVLEEIIKHLHRKFYSVCLVKWHLQKLKTKIDDAELMDILDKYMKENKIAWCTN